MRLKLYAFSLLLLALAFGYLNVKKTAIIANCAYLSDI
jgi:hypothetical protein